MPNAQGLAPQRRKSSGRSMNDGTEATKRPQTKQQAERSAQSEKSNKQTEKTLHVLGQGSGMQLLTNSDGNSEHGNHAAQVHGIHDGGVNAASAGRWGQLRGGED